jgi:hypothetical protein
MGCLTIKSRFDSWLGQEIFSCPQYLGTIQPIIQWVLGPLSLAAKREANHPPSSSGDFKNMWNHTSTPTYMLKAWCLIKQRDSFAFA